MMRNFSKALLLVVLVIPLSSQACGQEKIWEMLVSDSVLSLDAKVYRRVELQSQLLQLQLDGIRHYKESLDEELLKLGQVEEVLQEQSADKSAVNALTLQLQDLEAELDLIVLEKKKLAEQEVLAAKLNEKARQAAELEQQEIQKRLEVELEKYNELSALYKSGSVSGLELKEIGATTEILKLQLAKAKLESELNRNVKKANAQKSLASAQVSLTHLERKKAELEKKLASKQANASSIDPERIKAEKAILLKKIERVHMQEVELRLQQIELDAARRWVESREKAADKSKGTAEGESE